jgi:hypothetical protein
MSFEFLLFVPGPWGDPLEQGRKRYEGSSKPLEDKSVPSQNFKQNMQGAILAQQPDYEVLDTDFETIAEEEGISVAKARQLYRDVELSPPETDKGPHITVQDDAVVFTLTVPEQQADASVMFETTWVLMQACDRVQSCHVYVPQMDKVIRLREAHDREEVRKYFEAIIAALKRPWWKFW